MLNYVVEAMSVPYAQFHWLLRIQGDDMKGEYADRLATMDTLIAQNESGLKELLKTR